MCICCDRNNGKISDEKWEEITEIMCGWCQDITQLPSLPKRLQWLYCTSTRITELPSLPSTLICLECGHTTITRLPTIPGTLRSLYCWETNITVLPEMPESLIELDCSSTQITKLTKLPDNLEQLSCSDTHLTEIQEFKTELETLHCQNTWIKHYSNPSLKKNLAILRKVQRKIKNKLYLRRLSKQHILKKIFSPEITQMILTY